jgi:hypothetical protein
MGVDRLPRCLLSKLQGRLQVLCWLAPPAARKKSVAVAPGHTVRMRMHSPAKAAENELTLAIKIRG